MSDWEILERKKNALNLGKRKKEKENLLDQVSVLLNFYRFFANSTV
jgi:hypothetical protein